MSFSLQLDGLDQTLGKLKELNRLLDNISRKGKGLLGAGGHITAGAGGINIITGVPKTSSFSSGAIAGAAAGSITNNKYQNLFSQFRTAEEYAKFRGLDMVSTPAFAKATMGGRKMIDLNNGGGAGTPPVIPGASSGGSPSGGGWISKLSLSFLNLSTITATLWTLFTKLSEGVKMGTDAFLSAARIGHSISTTSQLQSAMQMIGISAEATQHMLLEAEKDKGKREFAVPGTNLMIAAAKISGFGNVQQLQNMSKQFEIAMKMSEASARQLELSSGVNLQTSMKWNEVVLEFKTLLAQYVADLAPLLQGLLSIMNIILRVGNLIAELGFKIQKMLGITALGLGTQPGTSRIGSLNNTLPHPNAWQHIGFVMQGGGPEKKLAEIATNTKDMVTIWKDLKPHFLGKTRTHGFALPAIPGVP